MWACWVWGCFAFELSVQLALTRWGIGITDGIAMCLLRVTFMAGEPATKPDISSEANANSVIPSVVMKFKRM